MDIKLFGKFFKYTFGALIVLELISLLTAIYQPLKPVAFLLILVAVITLTLKDTKNGIYIALAELFTGGKGYLFAISFNGISISIRIAIFVTIILIWLIKSPKNKLLHDLHKKIPRGYLVLAIFIIIGLVNGFINNEKQNAFFDFNAWIYFALIPALLTTLNKKSINNVTQVLAGATTYLSLKTIGALILFSHGITGIGGVFYKWIRDTGVGEVTYVAGNIFRVFMQSQLYVIVGLFIGLAILLVKKDFKNKNTLYIIGYVYLMSLTIIISQSRSFWVGVASGLITLLLLAIWKLNFRVKKSSLLILGLTAMIISQVFLIQVITNNFGSNVVGDRFKNLQTEAAGVSRISQLRPLTNEVIQQFIFGYGFGKTVTYKSSDPRIVAQNPDGIYTTYAFEWGYLDIILKLGILGLIAYLYLLFQITHAGLKKIKTDTLIVIGTLSALVAILATNMFSPYLNHPLGIGYLLLISTIYTLKSGR